MNTQIREYMRIFRNIYYECVYYVRCTIYLEILLTFYRGKWINM